MPKRSKALPHRTDKLRFPRYHTGTQAGALANLWRGRTTPNVQLRPESRSVVFSYEFKAPRDIPPELDHLIDSLVVGWHDEFQGAIEKTLSTKPSEGRTYDHYVQQNIHKTIISSFADGKQVKEFGEAAPGRSDPDPAIALSVLKRYSETKRQIKLVRKNTPGRSLEVGKKIEQQVEAVGLNVQTIKTVLQKKFGDSSIKPLFAGPAAEISRLIVAEELKINKGSLRINVSTYLHYAKKIVNALQGTESSDDSKRDIGVKPEAKLP
jgi:hypothetical protein